MASFKSESPLPDSDRRVSATGQADLDERLGLVKLPPKLAQTRHRAPGPDQGVPGPPRLNYIVTKST